MRRVLKIFRVILALCLAYLGAAFTPSGMGGICMLLAVFAAPADQVYKLLEDRWLCWLCIAGLLLLLSNLPLSDLDRAVRYLGWRIQMIRQVIQSIGG